MSWIFGKFYKSLKKEKYNKLVVECFSENDKYSDEFKELFKVRLIENRDEIIGLLKSIRKEYNIEKTKT